MNEYERQLVDLCESVADFAIERWEELVREGDEEITLSQILAIRFANQILSLKEIGFDLNNEQETDEEADARYKKAGDRIEEAVTTKGSGRVSLELVREIVRYAEPVVTN